MVGQLPWVDNLQGFISWQGEAPLPYSLTARFYWEGLQIQGCLPTPLTEVQRLHFFWEVQTRL